MDGEEQIKEGINMFVDSASNNSFWKGYSYFESGRVKSFRIIDGNTITGVVQGNYGRDYDVTLNLDKPRKSACTCPHSCDHPLIVCKHMVAVYFAAFPDDAKRKIQEIEDEADRERKELEESITKYVNSLSVKEVRRMLIDKLIEEETDNNYYRW